MQPNQNRIIPNPGAGPLAAFLQDPVINLRRRMTAILAEVYDQINQNRNQNEFAGQLADWFFAFRNAILNNEDIAGIVDQHLSHLRTLLDNPGFRRNPMVLFLLSTFIPRMHTIFGPQVLPNLPVPPPAPLPAPAPNARDRNEDLRQIRERVLGNQARRVQEEVQIGQQLDARLNAALQQGLDDVMQDKQGIFQVNMERLDGMAQQDRVRIRGANHAIDVLQNVIADVEAVLPNVENRVEAANRALDNLERAIQQAKQEVVQLNEAIDRKKESESNSIFITVLCIAACIAIKLAMPPTNAIPIPGGLMLGPPPFTF